MIELFTLGKTFPSDFLKPDEQPRCEPVELKLVMEANGFVHLEKTAPKEVMWGRYWYLSGINQSMKDGLEDVVNSILPLMKFKEGNIFLDVASNDGTLLSFVPNDFIKIGIDPAEDSFKTEAEKHANLIIQDYFSADVYNQSEFGSQKVKILTSVAVFYDLEHPEQFIQDVYEILEDGGLWVMQLSYSPLMIHQLAFDNILHEHFAYYTLFTLNNLLLAYGFKIMDCQLNSVNGGSFRVYIMKDVGDETKFGTQPYRDVCKFRIEGILAHEHLTNANAGRTWMTFFEKIKELKETVVGFIKQEKANGKTIWAMAASTKGNTLLQYFGLDNTLIDGICDRNPDKWGLRTIGTNIPIHSEEEFKKAKPDYCLVLAWHFISSFLERYSDYIDEGGNFIVPCSQFKIINKSNI